MCHKINIKYDIKIYPKKEIKDDIEIDIKIYPRPVRKNGRFWRWMIREGSGFLHPSASSAHPYITRIGVEDRIPGNISPLPNNPLMDLVNDDETFVVFVKIVLLGFPHSKGEGGAYGWVFCPLVNATIPTEIVDYLKFRYCLFHFLCD